MTRHSVGLFAVVIAAGFSIGCGRVDMSEYHEIKPAQVAQEDSATDSPTTDPKTEKPTEPTTSANEVATVEPSKEATSPTPSTDVPKVTPTEPIKVLVTDKEFSIVGPEDALRVTFEDIDLEKILDVKTITKDAPQYFPKWLKDLDNKRVRIRGFMRPAFEATGLRAFTLTRDTSVCCFGPNPKVCYLVDTMMRKGESVDYIENRPFEVVGLFHIGDSISPGELFTLDDAIVIAK